MLLTSILFLYFICIAPAENSLPNGDVNGDEAGHNKSDIIVITGKPENCEAAKLALQVKQPHLLLFRVCRE